MLQHLLRALTDYWAPRAPKWLSRLGEALRYVVCLFPLVVFPILLRLGLPIDGAS
jgi:hypothetical protein